MAKVPIASALQDELVVDGRDEELAAARRVLEQHPLRALREVGSAAEVVQACRGIPADGLLFGDRHDLVVLRADVRPARVRVRERHDVAVPLLCACRRQESVDPDIHDLIRVGDQQFVVFRQMFHGRAARCTARRRSAAAC